MPRIKHHLSIAGIPLPARVIRYTLNESVEESGIFVTLLFDDHLSFTGSGGTIQAAIDRSMQRRDEFLGIVSKKTEAP